MFTVCFTIHFLSIVEQFLYPTETSTSFTTENLKDKAFPAYMKLCVSDALNRTRLHQFGYESVMSYYRGISKYNSSVFGWSGHSENSSLDNIAHTRGGIRVCWCCALLVQMVYKT